MNEPASEVTSFADLGLDPRLLAALDGLGFSQPTPIQAEAIPPLLAGRDVIGRSRTGSGKTAAYGLPLLHRVSASTGAVRALILAPTRELALQVTEALRDLAKKLPVRVATVYGGAPYEPQLRALADGVPIVVGTPGRVLDHMERGSLDLSRIEVLVLDEADEMLRMGFLDAVETVVAACPPSRQIALLSATMPEEIQRVAEGHLRDPVQLSLGDAGPRVDHIEQRYVRVRVHAKQEAVWRLLRAGPPGATLIFARTRAGCAEVADVLAQAGVAVEALHGDLTQAARERVVHRLRAGAVHVLVATDVAARGIDVEHIGRVINYDLPDDVETYVHRIGRTARAGREGEALSLITPRDRRRLIGFAKDLGIHMEEAFVPSDADIADHQRQGLARALAEGLERGTAAGARAYVDELTAQGWAADELAVAALTLLSTDRGLDLRPVPRGEHDEPRSAVVRPEKRTLTARLGAGVTRATEPAPGREGGLRDEAPARDARPERPPRAVRPPRDPAERGAVGGDKPPRPRQATSPDRAPAQGDAIDAVNVFFPIGHRLGLRPADLVGALTHECGVPAHAIGRITILDRKSFVGLPRSVAHELLANWPSLQLRHQDVRPAIARPGTGPDDSIPRERPLIGRKPRRK